MLQVINLPCLLTPLSLKISATCAHKIQHAAWVCVQGAVQGARRGLPVIWITPLHVPKCVFVCVCLRDREFVCVWGGGLLWELPTHPPPSKKGCIKEEGGEAPLSLRSQTQRQSLWTHTFLQGHSDYSQKRSTCSYWILPEEDFLTEKRRGANLKDTQHLQSSPDLSYRDSPELFVKIIISFSSWNQLPPNYEDIQPALPSHAARSHGSIGLLCQAR